MTDEAELNQKPEAVCFVPRRVVGWRERDWEAARISSDPVWVAYAVPEMDQELHYYLQRQHHQQSQDLVGEP